MIPQQPHTPLLAFLEGGVAGIKCPDLPFLLEAILNDIGLISTCSSLEPICNVGVCLGEAILHGKELLSFSLVYLLGWPWDLVRVPVSVRLSMASSS